MLADLFTEKSMGHSFYTEKMNCNFSSTLGFCFCCCLIWFGVFTLFYYCLVLVWFGFIHLGEFCFLLLFLLFSQIGSLHVI